MKIAVYQAPPTDGDVDAALRRLEVQLRAAALAGADVLVAGSATFKGGTAHYAANIAALRGDR